MARGMSPMPEPEIPIERFEVFAAGLDHPECLAFARDGQPWPDGSGRVIGGPFGYANGLALTADERSLFLAESDTDRVYRFDLSADGDLGRGEVYAEPVGRLPDGLALDEAGNLYVACYASDEIWRVSPARQKALLAWDHHAILLGRPTNLAWGGANGDVLYVANLGRYTI